MSNPQAPSEPKHATAKAKPMEGSLDVFSRDMRSEIKLFTIIAVLVFVAAIILPTGDWLGAALEYQAYRVDEIIVGVLAVSFVVLIFLLRGWREVQRGGGSRADGGA